MKSVSRVRLVATPWTVTYQAPHGIFQATVMKSFLLVSLFVDMNSYDDTVGQT